MFEEKNCRFRILGSPRKIDQLTQYRQDLSGIYTRIIKTLKYTDNYSLYCQRQAYSYYFFIDKDIANLTVEKREIYCEKALDYYIKAKNSCDEELIKEIYLTPTKRIAEFFNRLEEVKQMIEVLINEKSENSA